MNKWIMFNAAEKGSAAKNWLDFTIFSLIGILLGLNIIYTVNDEFERTLPGFGLTLILVDVIVMISFVVLLILRQREE
jgi:hypothetical protein